MLQPLPPCWSVNARNQLHLPAGEGRQLLSSYLPGEALLT